MGTPFFVVFGWLSDKIGRKGIMLVGMLVAIASYRPIYERMYQATNLTTKLEVTTAMTKDSVVTADPKGAGATIMTKTIKKEYTDGTKLTEVTKLKIAAAPTAEPAMPDIKKTVTINDTDRWTLIWLVFVQVLFVTLVYGPIAAFLVEMFPTKIRYTSMSLPYHIGNGVFGGLLPAVATYLATGAKEANTVAEKAGAALPYNAPYLEGLWYPIIVAGVSFAIGLFYIKNRPTAAEE